MWMIELAMKTKIAETRIGSQSAVSGVIGEPPAQKDTPAGGRYNRRVRILSALLLVLLSFAASAQERELHWDALDVKARLESDGRLQVEETQRMVFTGDWNGGERTFDIRPRQQLTFAGMSRIDSQSGAEIPMSQGSLDTVDQWDYAEP